MTFDHHSSKVKSFVLRRKENDPNGDDLVVNLSESGMSLYFRSTVTDVAGVIPMSRVEALSLATIIINRYPLDALGNV